MADQVAKTTPTDFFEAIGQKVDTTDDDHKLVEEIESLCMNCHENVRLLPVTSLLSDATR
jgi:zinc finger protein